MCTFLYSPYKNAQVNNLHMNMQFVYVLANERKPLLCNMYIYWHSLYFHTVQVVFFILLKGIVSWDGLKKI